MEAMSLSSNNNATTRALDPDTLVISPEKQANGDLLDELSLDSKKSATSSPRPQRRLRLNRRGFQLSSSASQNETKSSAEKPVVKSEVHDSGSKIANPASNGKIRLKPSPFSSEKKVIKLHNSIKPVGNKSEGDLKCSNIQHVQISNSSSNASLGKPRSVVVVKKNIAINVEDVDSNEDPPKKKHKPITWP